MNLFRNKISLIPKQILKHIPMTTQHNPQDYQYVYIEDDQILRWVWEDSAVKNNILFLAIDSPTQFNKYIAQINKKTTKIYIDHHLGDNEISGLDFAIQLHHQGFSNIFMASGYEKENYKNYPWLVHVGKDCPFRKS